MAIRETLTRGVLYKDGKPLPVDLFISHADIIYTLLSELKPEHTWEVVPVEIPNPNFVAKDPREELDVIHQEIERLMKRAEKLLEMM